MDSETLNKIYIGLDTYKFLQQDVITYIKRINNISLDKNNIFFMDILFVYIDKIYDINQFKRLISANNILSLSNTNPDEEVSLFILPIFNDSLLDDYINMIISNKNERNFITYLEFINFKKVPMYLFDDEFLIKNNINIGSNCSF
jgi:hypothetical protein